MNQRLKRTLLTVAQFYDKRKVGDRGFLGFRRSTNLNALFACLPLLMEERILYPEKSLFLDLDCADGRVNVFLSYLVKVSVGIEQDDWTLEEYDFLRTDLEEKLREENLVTPPRNTFLFHGDSTDEMIHRALFCKNWNPVGRFRSFPHVPDDARRICTHDYPKG